MTFKEFYLSSDLDALFAKAVAKDVKDLHCPEDWCEDGMARFRKELEEAIKSNQPPTSDWSIYYCRGKNPDGSYYLSVGLKEGRRLFGFRGYSYENILAAKMINPKHLSKEDVFLWTIRNMTFHGFTEKERKEYWERADHESVVIAEIAL